MCRTIGADAYGADPALNAKQNGRPRPPVSVCHLAGSYGRNSAKHLSELKM
jgi:hypothetical protein